MPYGNDNSAEQRGLNLLDLTLDVILIRLQQAKTDPEFPLTAAELSAITTFMKQHNITISAYDAKNAPKARAITAEMMADMPPWMKLPGDA